MELTLARRPDGWLMAAEDGQSTLAELIPELQTSARRLYSPVDSGGERAAPPIGLTVRLSGEGDAPPLRSSRSAAPSSLVAGALPTWFPLLLMGKQAGMETTGHKQAGWEVSDFQQASRAAV